MTRRRIALVGCCAALAACSSRHPSSIPDGDAADTDADTIAGDTADAGATCQPVEVERGGCRRPLDTTLCAATWDTRDPPMCGLRVYEGPGAGYLLQYVSYADIPPIGGPSWMCVYDPRSGALAGAWTLDHYLRWCCESSLDMFQGVATDAIANVAVSMATHPACPDAGSEEDASPP